jgi:hypothetical protein
LVFSFFAFCFILSLTSFVSFTCFNKSGSILSQSSPVFANSSGISACNLFKDSISFASLSALSNKSYKSEVALSIFVSSGSSPNAAGAGGSSPSLGSSTSVGGFVSGLDGSLAGGSALGPASGPVGSSPPHFAEVLSPPSLSGYGISASYGSPYFSSYAAFLF